MSEATPSLDSAGPDRNGHGDNPYLLALLFFATIALSAFLWWISGLTAGPEHGGRYDVPAINGAAWWGFIVSIPAVLIVGGLFLSRVDEWVVSRKARRHAGDASRRASLWKRPGSDTP